MDACPQTLINGRVRCSCSAASLANRVINPFLYEAEGFYNQLLGSGSRRHCDGGHYNGNNSQVDFDARTRLSRQLMCLAK
jgi:hypothetical protein